MTVSGETGLSTCENVGCFAIVPLAEHTSPSGDTSTLCPPHGRLHEDGVPLLFDGDET